MGSVYFIPCKHALYARFCQSAAAGRTLQNWACSRQFASGDTVIFYFGKPIAGMVAVGHVASEPRAAASRTWQCTYEIDVVLPAPLKLSDLRHPELVAWASTRPERSRRLIPGPLAQRLLDSMRNVEVPTSDTPFVAAAAFAFDPAFGSFGASYALRTVLMALRETQREQAALLHESFCVIQSGTVLLPDSGAPAPELAGVSPGAFAICVQGNGWWIEQALAAWRRAPPRHTLAAGRADRSDLRDLACRAAILDTRLYMFAGEIDVNIGELAKELGLEPLYVDDDVLGRAIEHEDFPFNLAGLGK